jgi:hypothetical protein
LGVEVVEILVESPKPIPLLPSRGDVESGGGESKIDSPNPGGYSQKPSGPSELPAGEGGEIFAEFSEFSATWIGVGSWTPAEKF